MESLAYMLFYFLWGFLPWQGFRFVEDVLRSKQGITTLDLFHELLPEFRMFFEYCRVDPRPTPDDPHR